MATPTTTLPSAMLAALVGEGAHASAGKRLFTHHLPPKMLYLVAATALTAVLALSLLERTAVLVEA
jgi:hypothetical protein